VEEAKTYRDGTGWIHVGLTDDNGQKRAPVNTVFKLRVSQKARNFLRSRTLSTAQTESGAT
jgi:hypothetical protein